MDDLDKNKPAGAAPEADFSDDTRTRKTVRLRPNMKMHEPINLAGAAAPATPLADPMAGRDTDTGNLEVLNDTQTRRTVKLKPISPHPVVSPAAKLQIAPGAPAAPSAPATPASPAAPAAAAPESTNTVKVTKIIPAGTANDDRTVKVQRLNAPPKIGPERKTAPGGAADEKATVKLPTPAPRAGAPAAPTAPRPAPAASKPKSDSIGIAPSAKKEAAPPPAAARKAPVPTDELVFSPAGTVFRVVIALLVTVATLLVAVQFCDVVCGTDLASSIPGFPMVK